MRLSEATRGQLAPTVVRAGYDRTQAQHGIVHLGIGAFHRAHQAVYTDDANRGGSEVWDITGVSLRSPGVRDQMAPQDGLFTVTVRSEDAGETRLIESVHGVLVAPEAPGAVIAALAARRTAIVTFTVTEKGYHIASDGNLDREATALKSELAGGAPGTLYGFLEAALRERRTRGAGGLTLLSCDNLAENGRKLERLLIGYLRERDPALADWCAEHCRFPSSMVDRIVPATTPADLDRIEAELGLRDEAAVVAEPFRQWVIEDTFAGPRPAWEAGGAEIVADVAPYETAKLRMLNGAHSALAYLGLAEGLELVSEAIAHPEVGALARRLMREEAAPSFTPGAGQDLAAYAASLERRFANRALPHRLAQIAMDGSQKIPQRWLATLADRQRQGASCPAIRTALAAWIVHVRGDARPVDDPRAEELAALWREAGRDGIVDALVGHDGFFAEHWTPSEEERGLLTSAVLQRAG